MKLFIYHSGSEKPCDIHAILDPCLPFEEEDYVSKSNRSLCGETYLLRWDGNSILHLNTSRPFCKKCTELLKDDHNIDIKQLAINQKLGVK